MAVLFSVQCTESSEVIYYLFTNGPFVSQVQCPWRKRNSCICIEVFARISFHPNQSTSVCATGSTSTPQDCELPSLQRIRDSSLLQAISKTTQITLLLRTAKQEQIATVIWNTLSQQPLLRVAPANVFVAFTVAGLVLRMCPNSYITWRYTRKGAVWSLPVYPVQVVCPTFSTVPEYQDEWRILVRNLPSSQLKTKKSKQAHALALQSCLPNSVLDGGLDAQEMRGDEPSGKRAKRAENQSRTQNPNLSRALEHIMQVAAEAQDAQSSSPMLRQVSWNCVPVSGHWAHATFCLKAVRDEEVSHILRQILKEIKGLREDTKRQTEETREVSKLLKDFLGSRIPSQDLSGRPSNGSKWIWWLLKQSLTVIAETQDPNWRTIPWHDREVH